VRFVFFLKQKTQYEFSACLVGSEMCIRDSSYCGTLNDKTRQGYARKRTSNWRVTQLI